MKRTVGIVIFMVVMSAVMSCNETAEVVNANGDFDQEIVDETGVTKAEDNVCGDCGCNHDGTGPCEGKGEGCGNKGGNGKGDGACNGEGKGDGQQDGTGNGGKKGNGCGKRDGSCQNGENE